MSADRQHLTLTMPNQVWVAKLTYLRLLEQLFSCRCHWMLFRAGCWDGSLTRTGKRAWPSVPWIERFWIGRFPPTSFTILTKESNMRGLDYVDRLGELVFQTSMRASK